MHPNASPDAAPIGWQVPLAGEQLGHKSSSAESAESGLHDQLETACRVRWASKQGGCALGDVAAGIGCTLLEGRSAVYMASSASTARQSSTASLEGRDMGA